MSKPDVSMSNASIVDGNGLDRRVVGKPGQIRQITDAILYGSSNPNRIHDVSVIMIMYLVQV